MRTRRGGGCSTAAADNRGNQKKQQRPRRRQGHTKRQKHQRHLAHAQRPIADNEAAAAKLEHECRKRRRAHINADQCRVYVQILDNRGGDDKRQGATDGSKGLLHEHGAKRQIQKSLRRIRYHEKQTDPAKIRKPRRVWRRAKDAPESLAVILGIGVARGSHLQPDRHARHGEMLAEGIHQIAPIILRQFIGPCAENHHRGRARLGHGRVA